MRVLSLMIVFWGLSGTAGWADLSRVVDRDSFVQVVLGKELRLPLVKLRVLADGGIIGTGADRPVKGTWRWENGFFCRDLFWGERALGFNCQEVRSDGKRIRFTSDKGAGSTAVFRVRQLN